jgi:hypothetical protein
MALASQPSDEMTFPVTVSPSRTSAEALRQLDNNRVIHDYNAEYRHPEYPSHPEGCVFGDVTLVLHHYQPKEPVAEDCIFGGATTHEVLDDLARHGLRPANLAELIAFVEAGHHLRLQGDAEAEIVALGSPWVRKACPSAKETQSVATLYLFAAPTPLWRLYSVEAAGDGWGSYGTSPVFLAAHVA